MTFAAGRPLAPSLARAELARRRVASSAISSAHLNHARARKHQDGSSAAERGPHRGRQSPLTASAEHLLRRHRVYIPDPHRLSTKRCDCSSRRQKRLSTTAPPMHTATVPKGMRPVAATLGFGFGFGFGFGLGLVGLGLGLGLGAHGGPRGGDRWPPPGVPQCAVRTERPRLVRVPSTYRYVSRPAPPVRAQRGRPVRVARTYPTEAPGRTCQLSVQPLLCQLDARRLPGSLLQIRDTTDDLRLLRRRRSGATSAAAHLGDLVA